MRITILSTADLNSSVWTNKQYLAVGLADHYDVTYIESLGLRRPSLNGPDIQRMINRLRGVASRRSHATLARDTSKLQIISPKVVPIHGSPGVTAVNKAILKRTVARAVAPEERNILWTFSPVTYGIENMFDKVIYHSVDFLHTFHGVPSEFILRAEDKLLQNTDVTIASSAGIREHLQALNGDNVRLWENVADTSLFRNSSSSSRPTDAIFAGNMTPSKVDFSILQAVADSGLSLALAGPLSIDGTSAGKAFEKLIASPNVRYLGNLRSSDLAAEVGQSKVGLIPYHTNDHTSGIFPMKVYEYLAAGCSVVATPMKSLVESEKLDGVRIEMPGTFAQCVVSTAALLSRDVVQRNQATANPHSWDNRISQAHELILSL